MKDFASKSKLHLFIIAAITLLIFVPLYYSVNSFFLNNADEIINFWYQSEKTSIQQGNILSSVSKLQRPISSSILLQGIVVKDESGRELLKMGSDFKIGKNIHISKQEPQRNRIGLASYVYQFSSSGILVYILVSSYLPYLVTIGFASYLIILFTLFGYFIRREAIFLEKIKNDRILDAMKLQIELDKNILNLSKQVSHDIRSPLAALNMMMEETAEIPEDNRIIIRSAVNRINDIANQLLTKGKSKNSAEDLNDKTIISTQLISPLIDTLISEKRVQFRNKQDVEIVADLNLGHSLFANINPTELKRTLSNLINNSIEAFPDFKGKVKLLLTGDSEKVIVTLSDDGKGIPDSILKKLGEMGVSHGKEGTQSGSGLGVYHAKKTIESFGGTFVITSKENVGTTITMSFPRGLAPSWFVEKLLLQSGMQIVSLDDDLSIHQIWKGRFEASKTSEFGISHFTFTSGEEFEIFVQNDKCDRLYLVDYELLNQNATGLDLIEKLNIGHQSILVTSRYDEVSVRDRCDKLGVRLIPKGMAPFVPIDIQKNTTQPIIYDYVYIDDDEILRIGWGRRAKRNKINLLTLSSSEEFKDHFDQISKEKTHIYIDSSLGEGKMRGEDFAQILHNDGYKNLYIASGYEAEHFAHLGWLQYAGKECPFK